MAEQAAKRLKTGTAVTVATHNGHFHADEALAVHLLRRHVPEYAGATLVRSRDPATLDASTIVVDVGGKYDPEARRFDHHQRGFATTFPGRETKLSSAGLVYMHFGRGIVERRMAAAASSSSASASASASASSSAENEKDADQIYNKMYTGFVEALDAHDNGIDVYDPEALAAAEITKRYSDGNFSLGAIVGRYNAAWNDTAAAAAGQAGEDARFEEASARIGFEFDRQLDYLVDAWLPARSIVRAAFAARHEYDEAGRIVVFRGSSCPWKEHLYAEEEETSGETENKETENKETENAQNKNEVLYVLYPDKDKWRIQCVPVTKDSFTSRKPLPEAWRGFRDAELDKILEGIAEPGAIFVHAAGFIGGHQTFAGALAMAKKALEL